jgi:hypothetical protein
VLARARLLAALQQKVPGSVLSGQQAQTGMQLSMASNTVQPQSTHGMADCRTTFTAGRQAKLDTWWSKQFETLKCLSAHRLFGGQRFDRRQPRVASQAVQLRGGQPRHAAPGWGEAAIAPPRSAAAADGQLPGGVPTRHSSTAKPAKAAADLCIARGQSAVAGSRMHVCMGTVEVRRICRLQTFPGTLPTL